MKIINFVFVAALAAFPAVAGVAPVVPQASHPVSDPDDPFAGAWSTEALLEAAEPFLKHRRSRGGAAGDAALEARLSNTADPAERARLLTAYGVAVMSDGDDVVISAAAAFPFMKRAVAQGRQAFSPNSRMMAMLLSDAARTEFRARGAATSPEAQGWLDEAYRIRMAGLGPGHVETLSTLTALAEIRGAADDLSADPARVQAVADLYAPLLLADPGNEDVGRDLTVLFNEWTVFLAGARRPDEACAVLDKMNALSKRLGLDMAYAGYVLGEALSEAGYPDRAAPLVGQDSPMVGLLGEGARASDKPLRCGQ